MRQPEDTYTLDLLDQSSVTDPGASLPAASQLVLSLFPGIDLLGRGFENVGFSVVRGPDLIYGSDVRNFRTIPGRFDGVIGGSPCPDFSKARRSAPTGVGLEMLGEFKRLVLEARPTWWLLENVPGCPDVHIEGYGHQRIDINASECGLPQNRLRHFQFGHRHGYVITVERMPMLDAVESCCTASEGEAVERRSWDRFCSLQGLAQPMHLPSFTLSARYRAVGNAVPLPMAEVFARAIVAARPLDGFRLCVCRCGRPVSGKAVLATAACRKRMQRRRELAAVTVPA